MPGTSASYFLLSGSSAGIQTLQLLIRTGARFRAEQRVPRRDPAGAVVGRRRHRRRGRAWRWRRSLDRSRVSPRGRERVQWVARAGGLARGRRPGNGNRPVACRRRWRPTTDGGRAVTLDGPASLRRLTGLRIAAVGRLTGSHLSVARFTVLAASGVAATDGTLALERRCASCSSPTAGKRYVLVNPSPVLRGDVGHRVWVSGTRGQGARGVRDHRLTSAGPRYRCRGRFRSNHSPQRAHADADRVNGRSGQTHETSPSGSQWIDG